MKQVLVCDDDPSIVSALRLLLKSEGFTVVTASSPAEAEFFVKSKEIDLALIDLNYHRDTTSGDEGIALIKALKAIDSDLAVVTMTGWASIDIAVSVMQAGAGDFIQKPWENERLLSILNTQLALRAKNKENSLLAAENHALKQSLEPLGKVELIAHSMAMQTLLQQLAPLANSDLNILITGENGTGKSLLAEYIHHLSPRNHARFVSINMGAITDTLFESEMFGHTKGAYTDAKEQRVGRFELANGGTLFMDEVGNIPLSQQGKLLRVLESKQFEKVGSSKTQIADVRIVSATNADLDIMVNNKTFRQDLYYRLNTFVVTLPPLRTRKEDIIPLAEQQLRLAATRQRKPVPRLSESALQALEQYEWPGNVRELSHTMERAALLATTEIGVEHLMLSSSVPTPNQSTRSDFGERTMDDIEKEIITARLNAHKGNAVTAAKSLGLSRSAFYRRLEKFEI
ncbi:sigma-54-dependent transcriptional regulator [Pseudoalteromonas xiamenensis]